MAPSQRGEKGPVIPNGLAREGDLPILAMLAIQLYSYVGYMAIMVILVANSSVLGLTVKGWETNQ